MHARIAKYKVKPGKGHDVTEKAKNGMVAIFQQQPGFVAYTGVVVENDTVFSISAWETEQQANAAVQAAGSWVKENIADLIESVETHIGTVDFAVQRQHGG